MTLCVIGVGYGRTGTFSLKRALDQLGFGPCHHMYEVRQRPDEVAAWLEVANGARPDFKSLFRGYRSQVDWPGSVFWREMLDAYPDAKVILTERDPEAWHESIVQTILPASEIGRQSDPDPTQRAASEMMYKLALQKLFEGRLADRDFAISKFRLHGEMVRHVVPNERLLVLEPGDGWERLCTFLGKDIPAKPFPSGNTVADFRARKPYLSEG